MNKLAVFVFAIAAPFLPARLAAADDLALPPGVENTQDPNDQPPSPEESLKRITVPEGFRTTLFAAEPYVRQPIAFCLDDRGRLWVAEGYGYRDWAAEGHDRILVLEDTDGDGRFDERKVFWDKGNYISGVQFGYGGIWVCTSPNLLFIPDRDGDDVPDSEPEVVLDGWSTKGVHNLVNGLTWGPDGWLYGCNGITSPSLVGKPGAKDEDRVEINCGIWRYHPVRKEFEPVAHGTTNPWGLDYNEHGQFFFTNCVIGHLWHLIPGAHYERMFGQDIDPHSYGLIKSCSDHLHWAGGDWTKSRGGKGEHDSLGGGHAHVGCMIYLGDNWPEKYRGTLFTCNLHGNRVNNDLLEREGSGYVGRHGKDFLMGNDDWFRGLELKYGPDGGVFITDWTDLGECHDKDGVHRDSGRIYKVVYGEHATVKVNLAEKSDAELAALQLHGNEWYVRHAARLLAERAAAGKLSPKVHKSLLAIFRENPDVTRKLRAMWTLHATGGASPEFLAEQLGHDSEHVRWWAIRLLTETRGPADDNLVKRFAVMARDDESPFVRLGLASALQRLPLEQRWGIAAGLAGHAEDADDHNLPLMVWYGIEPLVAADSTRALALAADCKLPLVVQYIARRIAEK